jgi:hypothetical protein
MRRLLKLIALSAAVLTAPVAAEARSYFYYYYAPAWSPATTWAPQAAAPYAAPAKPARPSKRAERPAIAAYGPFRVLDGHTASLVAATDATSPAWFAAMLRDHPGIATLRFVECPGTYDDRANLQLGRMIRAAGIAAHVPDGGSVRSGAVELVLAGTSLTIDDGAEFAVHAWLDDTGHEATDYSPDSPMNRRYLSYYREMGMDQAEAASFYAMTNSVPFESARWLDGREMRGWVHRAAAAAATPPAPRYEVAAADLGSAPLYRMASPVAEPASSLVDEAGEVEAAPRLAYLDLGLTLF